METDYLIIGQGLCGTWLSYFLLQEQQSFLLIDQQIPNSASRVASGVINPVTGRRIVKTWMIDDLLPFVGKHYQAIGKDLSVTAITEKKIVEFFTTPQMQLAFQNRISEDPSFIHWPAHQEAWKTQFQYDFGVGMIEPCYQIDLHEILPAWRSYLISKQLLLEAYWDKAELHIYDDHIRYKDITAKKIIFCDGIHGYQLPWFQALPFGLNKGEALLVKIPGLSQNAIYKKGYTLVPWKDDVFWLGSTYLWEFENDQPSAGFYRFAANWLKQTVQLPFTILEHMAAIRPATLERRPFVGLHPQQPAIGILNGMGTKGCSLAPWFAHQFVQHLVHGAAIDPLAHINRFQKILSRNA